MKNKITEQFEALKSDVIVKIEKTESTASEAVSLAKENHETLKTFKKETTEKFICVQSKFQSCSEVITA